MEQVMYPAAMTVDCHRYLEPSTPAFPSARNSPIHIRRICPPFLGDVRVPRDWVASGCHSQRIVVTPRTEFVLQRRIIGKVNRDANDVEVATRDDADVGAPPARGAFVRRSRSGGHRA